MLYFAYGMNTNLKQMAQRCPEAVCLGRAKLPGWRFRFAGCADIVPSEQDTVDGVLWDITDNCLASLDQLEGYPVYYNSCEVRVYWEDEFVDAEVYYMNAGVEDDLPSDNYKNMVFEGYKENGVPINQLLDSISALEQQGLDRRVKLQYNRSFTKETI